MDVLTVNDSLTFLADYDFWAKSPLNQEVCESKKCCKAYKKKGKHCKKCPKKD
ncbi:hypothetical protein GCM10027275_46310 [Rhabdobacter roseus]|uniref:Ferric iron reductase protein FhuF n=1 Tax=Rhabdobacter roseus TaxID=1655419 RepID=A0A840U4D8_9BACT|nr:ferric iron reductase protein FhuF [Rhabdobacter roseus]